MLEKAGLIETGLRPATHGLQKVCARLYNRIVIKLRADFEREETLVEVSMLIGAFSDIKVTATCGLLGEFGIIGQLDDPTAVGPRSDRLVK